MTDNIAISIRTVVGLKAYGSQKVVQAKTFSCD